MPLSPDKKDGPTHRITFLGIVIDTITGKLSLPPEKLQRLLDLVEKWSLKKNCTRNELESLIGTMQHACKVIKPGRSFLRRAIALLSVAKQPYHHIRLTKDFRSDLMWWKVFAAGWNGTAIIINPDAYDLVLTSDASGSWGCGAWFNKHWFQLEWDSHSSAKSIAIKELIPIVIAAAIWGSQWSGKHLRSRCDNSAVVAVLNSRSCKDKDLMQLLRCLFFFEAQYQFHVSSQHIPGVENGMADDLSRNRIGKFQMDNPSMDFNPAPIPPSLLQWLMAPQQDWTSPHWTQQFSSFVGRV